MVVAGEAVDFEAAGNFPAGVGIGQLVGRIANAAAGQVAAELFGKFPRGEILAGGRNLPRIS